MLTDPDHGLQLVLHLLSHRTSRTVLTTMLLIDAAFILCHVLLSLSATDIAPRWHDILYGQFTLYSDTALPEVFNFVKWGMAAVLALVAFRLSRQRHFIGVAFASALFLIDDAGQVHERMGALFTEFGFSGIAFLDANSVGELVGLGGLALFVAIGLGYAFVTANPAQCRDVKILLAAIVGMFLCGVIGDIAHNLALGHLGDGIVTLLTGVIEDGGELLLISLYASVVFTSVIRVNEKPE